MNRSLFAFAALMVFSLSACVTGPKPYEPDSKEHRTLFMPVYRTAGPEPVYARTRWVHPPEVLPERESSSSATRSSYEGTPTIQPVYRLSMKKATLEETAKILASMARYSSYTSPSLAKQKFSFESLGTIDELARIIGDKAGIKVVVDHENKEVRFLVRTAYEPTLYSE